MEVIVFEAITAAFIPPRRVRVTSASILSACKLRMVGTAKGDPWNYSP